jgi:hypothetical protein
MRRRQQSIVNTLVWNVYEMLLHDFMFVKNFDGSKNIQRRQDSRVVQEFSQMVLDHIEICPFVSRVTTVI